MDVRTEQMLIEDAMVVMSGDMFSQLYALENDWVLVTKTIKSWARKFVTKLIGDGYKCDGSDELDFLLELEKFEDEQFAEMKKDY